MDRGSSDFDARQRFVLSYIYELPFGRGKALGTNWGTELERLLGGLAFSGIATFQSGRPIFIQLSPSNQNSNTGSTRDRPNIAYILDYKIVQATADPVIANRKEKTVYLNPAAFAIPPRGTFGNVPRNWFEDAGRINWDLLFVRYVRRDALNAQLSSG